MNYKFITLAAASSMLIISFVWMANSLAQPVGGPPATHRQAVTADADGNVITSPLIFPSVQTTNIFDPTESSYMRLSELTLRLEGGATSLQLGPDDDVLLTGDITVSGGGVMMPNLPVENPNVAGQLWNDGGTLKISDGL